MTESFDTELIGVPKKDITTVRKVLESYTSSILDILEPVCLPKGEIDSRVLHVRDDMNKINDKRMAQYGKEYIPPNILLIDRKKALEQGDNINQRLQKEVPSFGKFDSSSGFHQVPANLVLVFTHNFEDCEIDSYDTALRLRHEMSHAGSVKKIRTYNYELDDYRSGAKLTSRKRKNGEVINEGHLAVEDAMFQGENLFVGATSIGSSIADLNTRFPGVREKYTKLQKQLVSQGLIPKDKMMMHLIQFWATNM